MFLAAGGPRFFTFENLKAQQAALEGWRAMYPWQTMAAFFALYVAFTSASLPAASLLTILAGAIFGLGWGVLLVSFASAIGALLAMLAARFVLRDWVQDQFGAHLRGINEGIAREGGFCRSDFSAERRSGSSGPNVCCGWRRTAARHTKSARLPMRARRRSSTDSSCCPPRRGPRSSARSSARSRA